MGQKVNPVGLRLGINKTWDSRWYADDVEYGNLLHEDVRIRDALMSDLKQAAVSKVVVERPHRKCRVTVHTARPGIHPGQVDGTDEHAEIDGARCGQRCAAGKPRWCRCGSLRTSNTFFSGAAGT